MHILLILKKYYTMKKEYIKNFKVSSITEKVVSVRMLNDGWVDIKTDCDTCFFNIA